MKTTLLLCGTLVFGSIGCKEDPPAPPEGAAPASPSAAAVALAPSAAPSSEVTADDGTPFEGEVSFSVEVKAPKPATMKYEMLVKGSRTRMNVLEPAPEGGMSQIIDGKTGKMISLAHGPKLAMDMNLAGLWRSLAPWMPTTDEGDSKKPHVEKTDRTATIAGHTCRYWDYKMDSGTKGSVCLANLGVGWMSLDNIEQAKWVSAAFGQERFPLKSVSYDAGGKEEVSMEVTRLERKSIDDSVFEVPAGYQHMDTSKVMEGLMPAMMKAAEGSKPDEMKMPDDMKEMLEKLKKGQKP